MNRAAAVEERPASEPDWVAQYEALRTFALGGAPAAFVPMGVGLVITRGLPTWMAACRLAREPQEGGSQYRSPAGARDHVQDSTELVSLLAGVALSLVMRGTT